MQTTITKTTLLLIMLLLFGLPVLTAAQSAYIFTLTAEDLQNNKQIALDKLAWKYHAGDDLNWANPNFDDAAWETLNGTILRLDNLPKSGWNGIGWFRFHLKVDESLTNQQLALITDHWGASEVYVDGKLINRFGKVGASAETEEAYRPNKIPVVFSFHGNQSEHLIAVRHSVMALRDPSSLWGRWLVRQLNGLNVAGNLAGTAGIEASLVKADNSVIEREGFIRLEVGTRFWRFGLTLTFCLLFLLLYYFYPSSRANLYFAIFAFFNITGNLGNYLRNATHYDIAATALFGNLVNFTVPAASLFLLVFLYTVFAGRIPKYFWIIAAGFLCFWLQSLFFGTSGSISLLLGLTLYLIFLIEPLRVMINALLNKQNGAWIVAVGVAFFSLIPISNVWLFGNALFHSNTPLSEWFRFFANQFSTIGITFSIAIYLARQFAQTNKNLEAKLVEVEAFSEREIEHERDKAKFLIVEAENERRAKELEEARQLQLSMLPKKLPVIPNLEIAAYMKPATEVGGDYYDFHVAEDGTLTVAVGDATGHGLKAGTMVTAAKTLFNNLASEPNIESIFKQSSAALKKLNLRGMFMAMTMAKIENNHLRISSAGMPSALIYRSAVGAVEELAIRAVPLGSLAKTNYPQRETTLAKDDVVVLMSDGFPEMFNPENEMLGFEKAAEILPDIAQDSAQEIINHLVKIGDDWANGRPQDDDVTFVVLKVKTDNGVTI